MTTMDQIGEEKRKLSDQLTKIAAEKVKIEGQLAEIEAAEKVIARFEKPSQPTTRRGRPPKQDAATVQKVTPVSKPKVSRTRVANESKPKGPISVADAVLKCVASGASTPNEILAKLSTEYGLTARPNHLGIALQRHRRAGRLQQDDANTENWAITATGYQEAQTLAA